jgi:hypothetical protein
MLSGASEIVRRVDSRRTPSRDTAIVVRTRWLPPVPEAQLDWIFT